MTEKIVAYQYYDPITGHIPADRKYHRGNKCVVLGAVKIPGDYTGWNLVDKEGKIIRHTWGLIHSASTPQGWEGQDDD